MPKQVTETPRTYKRTIMLTAEEDAMIRDRAYDARLTISDYMRAALKLDERKAKRK